MMRISGREMTKLTLALILCLLTCASIVICVLFCPVFRLRRLRLSAYWVCALTGALLLLLTGRISPGALFAGLSADTAINPLKILVLFFSMTALSVYLDEIGFFRYLAGTVLRRAGTNQRRLFLCLYVTVATLTVFTSNDIIVLTFTPFICYLAKNAGIDPLPYLMAEFVAANTWSMLLLIGNPTNIYLSASAGISFAGYLRVMALPTLLAGILSLALLLFLFRHPLAHPMETTQPPVEPIRDRVGLGIGLAHLCLCTIALAVSSYLSLPMWLIALGFALSLLLCVGLRSLIGRKKPTAIAHTLRRLPWQLIPFVLSMFTLVLTLGEYGVTARIAAWIGTEGSIVSYGVLSFLSANLINNIPMSVLFSSVLDSIAGSAAYMGGVYASVIGSNIGAYLTPLGALAGIMWMALLREQRVPLSFGEFIRHGAAIACPALLAALLGLAVVL